MSITPADCATQLLQQMANMHRWKSSALAAAALALGGLYAADASALALGRITVQSALGEPLRAEIELPQISASEAETLRTQVAPPETFRAQGMEYSPAINGVQVQLQRRSDGSMVLRLSSTRPINEPFVDLVLNASWGSGQIVRSYTMLFDPPTLRQPPAAVTAPAQAAAPAAPAAIIPAPAFSQPPRSAPMPAVAPVATPRPAPRPAAEPATDSVTVRPGDTAGRLAGVHRPSGVSLDQMLVAMMRSNPDAFVGGNVNRLKSGVVLHMPDAATAQAVPATEARQIVAAQSRDFNEFRRKLAASAPSAEVATQSRSASGKVQTQVEDKRPAQAAPDKLTLSKGAIKGQKGTDEKLAQDKQSGENATRMAELSRNISELNKIGAASAAAAGASAAAPAATAASAPGIQVPATAPATPVAPASQAETPAPVQPAASAPVAAASAAAEAPAQQATEAASNEAPPPAPAPKPQPAPAPEPAPEPSFIDGLLDDPLIPLAGGGILALLLGYGGYRVLQRRRQAAMGVDSSFMESKLQPDSFFGQSGGQRVDTANSEMTTGSSLAYSPSQLDAGGDVDPVAEADVYLAYGRDLQAEEILKEALRSTPDRLAIRTKLLEVYAKRRDTKGFEQLASQLYSLTQGEGEDWARIQELGLGIDPENPLYQPGGQPAEAPLSVEQPADGLGASTIPHSVMPAPSILDSVAPAVPENLAPADESVDLDLDISSPAPLDEVNDSVAPPVTAAGDLPPLDLPEFGSSLPSAPAPAEAPLEFGVDLPNLEPTPAPAADADGLDFGIEVPPAPAPAPAFDLGDISLDLDAPAAAAPAVEQDLVGELSADPMARKLELADEFRQIGDADGARELLQEVVEQAQDAGLKARAQSMLDSLS